MNDGAVLVEVPGPVSPSNIPTEVISRVPPAPRTAPWIYVIAGALGAIVIIGAVYLFSSRDKETAGKFTTAGKTPETRTPAATPTSIEIPNKTPVNTAPPANVSPKGHWSGDWSSPSGAYLTIVVDLDDDGTGGVTGRIEWTLRRTMRPEKVSKIGMSATEYVGGRFDPATRTLSMKGYRKDDPNNVLVMLDSYRLVLSGDTSRLNGTARNGGKWNATVSLSR